MAELKTQRNQTAVPQFIASITDMAKRADREE
jgi:hypothetical protein